MKCKVKNTIVLNYVLTLTAMALSFVINRNFSLYLGTKNLGIMRLFTQLLAYLSLMEMGLGSASTFALYKPLVEKNYKRLNVVISTINNLYRKIFYIILIVGLLLTPMIPLLIKEKVEGVNIYIYWSLYVINISVTYVYAKYNILFLANQEFDLVRKIQGGSKIFFQIIQLLILIYFHSFILFIFALILDNITQYLFLKKNYKKKYTYIHITSEQDRTIIRDLKNLVWHKVAGVIVYNTDYILISRFLSLEIIAVYSSYLMVTQMLNTLFIILLNVLRPLVGKYISENNKEMIYLKWKQENSILVFFAFVATSTFLYIINDFMYLWLGRDFLLSKLTVRLILINVFIQNTRALMDIYKEGSGFFDDIELPIAESVINFIVSIILINYLGLNGVIIGTLTSNILIIVILRPILVFKRCFNKNIFNYLKVYGNYLILILIAIFLQGQLNLEQTNVLPSIVNFFEKGIKVFVVNIFITGVVFYFGNKEFKKLLKKLLLKK